MRHALFLLATTFILVACGGASTQTESDFYSATLEAEKDTRQIFLNCTFAIMEQVNLLENAADACSNDYDCRAIIAQQIEELGNKMESTCAPVPSDLSDFFVCKIRLVQAKANLVNGAPNETFENRILVEKYLRNQVYEAYEYCHFLISN